MLELSAATGEIDLKYLDQSGFCIWSERSYTYYQRGEQKNLEQTKRRGRRLSIIGLLQHWASSTFNQLCLWLSYWRSEWQILYPNDGA
jgi:putative transposase